MIMVVQEEIYVCVSVLDWKVMWFNPRDKIPLGLTANGFKVLPPCRTGKIFKNILHYVGF